MLEALLSEGGVFKRIIESIKELVTDGNFDATSAGLTLQAMDSSHVALVALLLRNEGFDHFRCDRTQSLGLNLGSLAKIMKCAANDDAITLKADDGGDSVSFMFEAKNQSRISHFSLKLIDIDAEHLGIPDTEYKTTIRMPSSEFQRICKELAVIGDTVSIQASKDGVKFSVKGEAGDGSIVLKQTVATDEKEDDGVMIKMEEEVNLTFALRYLNHFCKATALCSSVVLKMSPDVPLVVEYVISTTSGEDTKELGHIRFYLAPKIEEGGEEAGAEKAAEKEAEPAAPAPAPRRAPSNNKAKEKEGGDGDGDAEMPSPAKKPEAKKPAVAAAAAAPPAAAKKPPAKAVEKDAPDGGKDDGASQSSSSSSSSSSSAATQDEATVTSQLPVKVKSEAHGTAKPTTS